MANIYDMAKITSGDPMGRAREGAKEASTLLAQYQHQKDISKKLMKQLLMQRASQRKVN